MSIEDTKIDGPRTDDPPEQQAWNEYVAHEYIDRNSIIHAHRAFLAGWKIGYDAGYSDADAGG